MQLNLRLSHKGLILISVPLVFEIFFVAVLTWLHHQAAAEAAQQERTKQIIAAAQGLEKAFFDASSAVLAYGLTGNKVASQHCDETFRKIPELYRSLRELSGRESERLRTIDQLEKSGNGPLTVLVEFRDSLDEKGRTSELLQSVELRKGYENMTKELIRDIHSFVQKEKDLHKATHLRFASLVVKWLVAGVIVSLLISILLAVFFSRSITSRLAVLMDNTGRLTEEKELNPVISGSDELTDLDVVFHQMADALAEAKTKEKAFLETIKLSEERIRTIIEHMPIGLLSVNEEGVIVSGNPALCEIFGFNGEKLEGRSFGQLFKLPPMTNAATYLAQLHKRSWRELVEVKALRVSGEEFAAEISTSNVMTKEGLRTVVNIQDVTERHELERLKQEFVAIVSHDLRSPLTSIQGSLTLLDTGAFGQLDKTGKKIIETCETSAQRLIRLVNDLLDVEKLEAGKFDMELETIELAPVLERSIEAVRQFGRQQLIDVTLTGEDATVCADVDRIEQVLINLLSNAIKFSPAGSTVEVSMEKLGRFTEVRVKDSGCGIPASHLEAIFERFKQVRAADAKKKGGTGLGLAICKAIIEQHGGQIGVDSREKAGSTFWFRLPLTEEGAAI